MSRFKSLRTLDFEKLQPDDSGKKMGQYPYSSRDLLHKPKLTLDEQSATGYDKRSIKPNYVTSEKKSQSQ